MIVPMKKIHLIFHSSQVEECMLELQELGIVDINYGSFNLESEHGKEYLVLTQALHCLRECRKKNPNTVFYSVNEDVYSGSSLKNVSEVINGYFQEIIDIEKQNLELEETYQEVLPLGDVSSNTIEELQAHNISLTVYTTDRKVKKLPSFPDVVVKELFSNKGKVWYVVIQYGGAEYQVPLNWNEFILPTLTVSEIRNTIAINKQQQVELYKLLESKLDYETTIKIRKIELENILLRNSVVDSGNSFENQLLVLEGFFPAPDYIKIHSYVKDKNWGMVISNPSKEEDVPTLTKNFSFIRIIKPLFKLMDTVPGYKEFDISAMFLLFISLFYAMIIGDAGYGTLMFVLTLLFTFKAMKQSKVSHTHILLLWFSGVTIVWGALTGNWFGYAPFAEIPFLNKFVFNPIYTANNLSSETIMLFSFRIGLLHLLLAHFWKICRVIKESFWAFIYELANGVLLIGLYFVVLFLILDPSKYPVPNFALLAIGIGVVLIIITCEQEKGKNFFVGILKGLASLFNLFLGWVGNLADLISYIRLYAVGLASLAIAQAFNAMGLSIIGTDASPVVSIILLGAGAIVIGIGHALNLAMALLAVMVHGVRLNMLEFGMHLGMEWTGRSFTPFQKTNILLEEK